MRSSSDAPYLLCMSTPRLLAAPAARAGSGVRSIPTDWLTISHPPALDTHRAEIGSPSEECRKGERGVSGGAESVRGGAERVRGGAERVRGGAERVRGVQRECSS
jgi:hypothetical protein